MTSNQLIGEYFNGYSIVIWLGASFSSGILFTDNKENLIFSISLYSFILFIDLFLMSQYGILISNMSLFLLGILFSILLFYFPSFIIISIKNRFNTKPKLNENLKENWKPIICPTCKADLLSNSKFCSNCNAEITPERNKN
ncbi:MAG: hypothetical protein ACTSVY_03610 [Candidatus Helarchaeota archaeon]